MDMPRRILITGCSRGLGRALVEGFTAAGHTVWGCARSRDAVAALQSQFPEPHHFASVDVTDETAVASWIQGRLAHGEPDLVINNAGIINANAPLWEVPAAEFNAVIDVNIKGVANVLRYIVPALQRRQHGVIVNLSSGWGRSVSADVAPYCASKWAIEGLTQALAQELPSGIAAIPVNPGVIHTEMLDSCFGEQAASFPNASAWAKQAVPFFLGLGPKDNGQPLTVG